MRGNKDCKPVSIIGWLGVIILSAIPGVNLIMWIVWTFASKRLSLRNFSIAMIILTVLFAALIAVGIALFGTQMLEWARSIDPELFTKAIGG